MKTKSVLILCIAIIVIGCKSTKTKTPDTKSTERIENNSSDIKLIKGIAYDRKGGAVVEHKSIHYWIEGKDSWEDKYLNKTVIVKGTIVEKNDNPVFLDTSDVKMQGIPVKTEEELQSMSGRLWIINAEISLTDN